MCSAGQTKFWELIEESCQSGILYSVDLDLEEKKRQKISIFKSW